MNYKAPYILTVFLFFTAQPLNAISGELNLTDTLSIKLNLTDTPSIKLSKQLTNTCSVGVKLSLESINPFIFYVLYEHGSRITYEQIAAFLNPKNPNCCVNAQLTLYLVNQGEHGKIKTETIIANNQNLHFSLESLVNINKEYCIKKHMILNLDTMPEFDIAFQHNKKTNATTGLGLEIQGFIKNNQDHYISINYFYPWNDTLGVKGNIIFNNDTILPNVPTIYTPTKNSLLGCTSAMALNIAIPCAIFAGSKEIELRFPNKKHNKAYAKYIMEKLDYNRELLDDKINELKKEVS